MMKSKKMVRLRSDSNPLENRDGGKAVPHLSLSTKVLRRKQVLKCLNSNPVDIQELRRIAYLPHGFLDPYLRRKVWPKLLNINTSHKIASYRYQEKHSADSQIQKDIDRSMWHYACLKGLSDDQRSQKRRQLTRIIKAVLNRNYKNEETRLFYYQGYHDICTVFLLVLEDPETVVPLIERVSLSYHREAMRKDFRSIMDVLQLLFPLIKNHDTELHSFLLQSKVEPFFALPWLITWFAHHLDSLHDVCRIYDVMLSSHPLFALYMSAAVVLDHRESVMQTECDFGMVHNALSKLTNQMNIESHIQLGAKLFEATPPEKLLSLSKQSFDPKSVLFKYPKEVNQKFSSLTNRILFSQSRDKLCAIYDTLNCWGTKCTGRSHRLSLDLLKQLDHFNALKIRSKVLPVSFIVYQMSWMVVAMAVIIWLLYK